MIDASYILPRGFIPLPGDLPDLLLIPAESVPLCFAVGLLVQVLAYPHFAWLSTLPIQP